MTGRYLEIGICGLSCRLCPMYHIKGESRCSGCKSESRKFVGCSFITCAVKKKGINFCWKCGENDTCKKWEKHREFSKHHDSFVCYQKLEDNINFIRKNGAKEFEKTQKTKEKLLKEMLKEFNEGRSKSLYCITSTVLEIKELRDALNKARRQSEKTELKEKAKILRQLLTKIAERKNCNIKLIK